MIFEEENEIEARVKEIADAVNGANSTVAIKCAILKPIFLHNIFKKKGYLKNDFVPLQYSNLNE